MPGLAERLPDFPWDTLAPAKARAEQYPAGIVDLSIGTPVDPTPAVAQEALAAAANAPGYPTVAGAPETQAAIRSWAERVLRVRAPAELGVLPAIGTKEMVAWLPTLLGLGSQDTVVIPEVAYPTYEVGALVAGCRVVRADSTVALGPQAVSLIWLNSPANPTGRVLGAEHLAKVVAFARDRGAVVVSDECYFELPWSQDPAARPVSILHPEVCGGSYDSVVALHSLSKRSNLAGYRFGFAIGDPAVLAPVLSARKHTGFMVPTPVQRAAQAVLADDRHVVEQRARYRRRREVLSTALVAAGFRIDHSEAGLYLWATRGEDCWATVEWLADRGILVAPGAFYGAAGSRHVRVALTATDVLVDAAAQRLAEAAEPVASQVAGRRSQVAGRRSQVAGRRSQVAGRRSQVAGPLPDGQAGRSSRPRRASEPAGRGSSTSCAGRASPPAGAAGAFLRVRRSARAPCMPARGPEHSMARGPVPHRAGARAFDGKGSGPAPRGGVDTVGATRRLRRGSVAGNLRTGSRDG